MSKKPFLSNYDAAGQLRQRTDPVGNTTRYQYNSLGQTLADTDPLGNAATFAYL